MLDGAELQLEVEDGRGVGGEGEGLLEGGEAGVGDGEDVVAEGDGGEGEGAVGLVAVDWVKAELAARSSMCAPGMGRCWGSWTTPWTWLKMASVGRSRGKKQRYAE